MRLSKFSIDRKLLLSFLLVVILVALFNIIAIHYTLNSRFKRELKLRGVFVARGTAARIQEPLLMNDYLHLYEHIEEEKRLADDITYIFVINAEKKLIAHTFVKEFPKELMEHNKLASGQEFNIELFDVSEKGDEYIYDIAVPILLDKELLGTVRVGLKLKPTLDKINDAVWMLAIIDLMIAALCILISTLLSRQITRPIQALATAAENFSNGKISAIPELGERFNCWEVMQCEKEDCPAHGNDLLPCWYTAGTMCQGEVQGIHAQKLGDCKKCKYYKKYFGNEIDHLAGALLYMACTLVKRDEERKKHLKELTLINRLIKDISSKLDLGELLISVVKNATEAIGADAGAIAIYDEQKQQITYPYFYNMPDNLAKVIVPKGGGLAGQTMKKRKPILLEDYPSHPSAVPEFVADGLKNLLAVPLISGDKVLGALGVFGLTEDKKFDADDVPVVQAIGDEAAIAMDNARLFEAVKKSAADLEIKVTERTRQITTLYRISRKLSEELKLTPMLDNIIYESVKLLQAKMGAIGIIDYELGKGIGRSYNAISQRFEDFEFNLDWGVPTEIIRTRKSLRVENASERFAKSDPVVGKFDIKSFLTMPIIRDDKVIALLGMHDKLGGGGFTEEDEEFLSSISDQAALIIEKCGLYENLRSQTQQLQEANQKLAELYRLKSEFLANISHELRTPLNSIIGFTGITLQGLTGEINAEQQKQLKIVYDSAKHLLELINDVLDMSKIEAGKMRVSKRIFDIKGVINESMATVSPVLAEKGLKLIAEIPEDGFDVYSDRAKIKQVLINFLSNAAKFTIKGYVEVRGYFEEESRQFIISVSDTGIGIKQQNQEDIFDMFMQAPKPYEKKPEGTGLGLSISKKIVEMLGGKIWLRSQPGKGSTFSFSFPVEE